MLFKRIHALFAIPDTTASLAFAQLSALKQQVPLLYLILTINAATLAYTHYGVAPTALVLLPVMALSAICIARGITWTRLDLAAIPPERYVPLLRRTNRLTAVLSPGFLVWSLSLAHYGDEVSNLHVFFFLALTPIGCIFCLIHLRSAAIIVATSVIAPAVAFVLHRHGAVLTSIAINLLLVGGVMLFILFIQYRDFVRLAKQNEALKELGDQNLRLASTDMLTGLPNRRSFFPALADAIQNGSGSDASFVLGIIDLDGFKGINDTFGHVAGDRVLVEVAERLSTSIPPGAFLARLGGDEFALIMGADTPDWDLERTSRAVFAAINRPFVCLGSSVRIGASIGFARFAGGCTAAQLLERADFALYEAKAHHRGTWILFAAEHEERMRLQGAIENALRHADLSAELSLMFQPMVDVARGRTLAFEALARWHSPHLGRVPPDRFIPVAERIGLINEITAVLFGKALHAIAEWPADVAVSFNLSMADITSPEAITRLCAMIEASGIDPTRLQFEATETAMLGDFAQARAGLERLKAMGATLSLDDFGTGYSSLSHVHRLPVDKLKIDQSFTRELSTHETARNIVAAIIGLSRNLKLDCVVEGVETVEQSLLLQSYGCRLMQGYLFRKPMPADEVVGYLKTEQSADFFHFKSTAEGVGRTTAQT